MFALTANIDGPCNLWGVPYGVKKYEILLLLIIIIIIDRLIIIIASMESSVSN